MIRSVPGPRRFPNVASTVAALLSLLALLPMSAAAAQERSGWLQIIWNETPDSLRGKRPEMRELIGTLFECTNAMPDSIYVGHAGGRVFGQINFYSPARVRLSWPEDPDTIAMAADYALCAHDPSGGGLAALREVFLERDGLFLIYSVPGGYAGFLLAPVLHVRTPQGLETAAWDGRRVVAATDWLAFRDSVRKAREDSVARAAAETEARRVARIQSFGWPPRSARLVMQGAIALGMSPEMVRESWGRPDRVNRSVGVWGVHEQWMYDARGVYVYFENGKLTSWQESHVPPQPDP